MKQSSPFGYVIASFFTGKTLFKVFTWSILKVEKLSWFDLKS